MDQDEVVYDNEQLQPQGTRLTWSYVHLADYWQIIWSVLSYILKSTFFFMLFALVQNTQLTTDEALYMQYFASKVLLLYGLMNLGFLLFATCMTTQTTLFSQIMIFTWYMLMFLGSFLIVQLSVQSLQDNMQFKSRPESRFIWLVYYCCLITNAMLSTLLIMFFTWLVLLIVVIAYSEYTGTNVFNIDLMQSQEAPHMRRSSGTQMVLKRLKAIPYTGLMRQSMSKQECVICLTEFKQGDDVFVLRCSSRHVFHNDCLTEWIKINPGKLCPICRADI